jgi:nucleoside-diphosphate-sugar epimerase
VRELAEAVAAATGARTIADDGPERARTLSPADAAKRMDQMFTAARARRELGWVPHHASFVAEARALHDEWQRLAQTVG